MSKVVLIFLLLMTAGCGLSPGTRFWYHPQRTVEQAKLDVERCYDEAFLTEQGRCYSPGSANDRRESLLYVEINARQCMEQAGYRRVSQEMLDPAARKKTGTVHGVTYFVAGR
ncbi:MAG: hypothetical protein ACYS8Z_07075 [Planctomycetota bacterium]|jgi:hypothetical protein